METTRRGFFGLVVGAGAACAVPVGVASRTPVRCRNSGATFSAVTVTNNGPMEVTVYGSNGHIVVPQGATVILSDGHLP